MRDLTKSMFSWTWAMSVFGAQQMMDMAGGAAGSADCASRASRRFDNIAAAAAGEMGQTMRAAFDAGNNMQRSMVDLFFGSLAMLDPQRLSRMAGGATGQASASQGCSGAGAQQPDGGMRGNPFAQNRPAGGGMPGGSAPSA
ncbi:MAG TPA: hypothetical protein VGF59_12405 [Bryobacteraceae bacterium]|jgi:hypothetical protein